MVARLPNLIITEEFLNDRPDARFVFGDNLLRFGYGGAAKLRDHPQAIGFITKKAPDNKDQSFFRPEEYSPVFLGELKKLTEQIVACPELTFYISQLGAGLANRHYIWERVIRHNLEIKLSDYPNVIFLWE